MRVLISLLGMSLVLLSGCATVPDEPVQPAENDVCVGEPIVVEDGKDIDLEALARQAECPE